jgi:methylmalonyl-CoA/ethylmalonyl-CoA epimerase
MPEPAFTQTMQIGIVVRDLNKAIRTYEDGYGIGPWSVFEVTPEMARDVRVHGRPAVHTGRAAIATIGNVMWELIEPVDEDGIFGRFLAEKGEGVHHVAVATERFDELVAAEAERGRELVLRGTFSGIDIAYLPTEQDLGVVLEIFEKR